MGIEPAYYVSTSHSLVRTTLLSRELPLRRIASYTMAIERVLGSTEYHTVCAPGMGSACTVPRGSGGELARHADTSTAIPARDYAILIFHSMLTWLIYDDATGRAELYSASRDRPFIDTPDLTRCEVTPECTYHQ